MMMPILTGSIARPIHAGAFHAEPQSGVVISQPRRECTPCTQVESGQWCNRLLDRRFCLRVPSSGSWRMCCNLRWSPNPYTCGLSRC
jgi:hypothetical protein